VWDLRRSQGQPDVPSRYVHLPRTPNEWKGRLNLSLLTLSRLRHLRLQRIRGELRIVCGTIIPREVRRDEANDAES